MSMLDFTKTLSGTANVAVQITTTKTVCSGMTIVADRDNTGIVSVGDVTQQSTQLAKGDSIPIYPMYTNEVYVKTTVPGDKVTGFIYS